jgi:uroporphyrinogen III methyltransferase/synthase
VRAGAVTAVGALARKRILVTRAREQAEKTAAAIRARGAEPILLPTIELHPPRDPSAVERALAAARAGAYGWVAFTSENGVDRTWAALGGPEETAVALGAAVFGAAKLAAIGPGTAAALAKRGLRVDLVATESKGEGLARAVLAAMAPGEPLLLLRAQVARDVFPDALRAAGHRVDVVAVYETRPASGPDSERVIAELSRGEIDAVTFSSASTVESFVALVGGAGRARDLLLRTTLGSIGPITSEALGAHGLRVDATAAKATIDGLLDALEARFAASEA